MANPILLTAEGLENLKKELEFLKGPERRRIADAIREAKAHGDLRENAAYHEAKLNQSRLDARIAELERAIQSAKVVERPEDAHEGSVHLGSRVTLLDLEFEEQFSITLVGNFEADPANEKISISSPMGEALLGKVAGDEVDVAAPQGASRYRILDVA
jgi:transcription elongation factor GreA